MAAVRNFHLPLPEATYRRLREAAELTRQPATVVARYAIETWLRDRRREAVHQAIAEYATNMAGTGADLDPELEAASLETWPKRKRSRSRRR